MYICTVALLLVAVANQISSQPPGYDFRPYCASCICRVLSKCEDATNCPGDNNICQISEVYYRNATSNPLSGDYERCAKNFKCASEKILTYLKTHERDCNGDRFIHCDDYMSLHVYGPDGCSQVVDKDTANDIRECVEEYGFHSASWHKDMRPKTPSHAPQNVLASRLRRRRVGNKIAKSSTHSHKSRPKRPNRRS